MNTFARLSERLRLPPIAVLAAAVLCAGAGGTLVAVSLRGPVDAGRLPELVAVAPEQSEERVLRTGMTLGSILRGFGVSQRDHVGLLAALRERADPRRLKQGTAVRWRWRDEITRPHAVDVVWDADRTIRLTRSASGWTPSELITPTTTDTVAVAGEITAGSGLWLAVSGNQTLDKMTGPDRGDLIHGLDQVFRWQIDFSRQVRPGDTYRFVVERQMRPDGTMKSDRLLAAELVNRGRALHAIWFDPAGDVPASWFDLEGLSVRRTFLKKPLDFRRISSGYSGRRYHPILKRWRAHRGVDYAADSGTPVQATGDGVVTRRGWSDSYGRVIDLRHSNGFLTRYAHLSTWAGGTATGSRVKQGQVIGYVGMTGMATGPHLHYEMHRDGQAIDPLETDLPAGDPVPAEERDRFEREMAARLAMLPLPPGLQTLRTAVLAPEEDEPGL